MDLNFGASVKLTNLLLPHLETRPRGHVVFTNSSSGAVSSLPCDETDSQPPQRDAQRLRGVCTPGCAALYNFGGFNAYSTSKVALLNFSRILRRRASARASRERRCKYESPSAKCVVVVFAEDLRGSHSRVSVTSILPGYVPTNIFKNIYDEEVKDVHEPKADKPVEVGASFSAKSDALLEALLGGALSESAAQRLPPPLFQSRSPDSTPRRRRL